MFKNLVLVCCYIPFIVFSQENKKDSIYVKKLMDEAYSFEAKNPKKALEIYKEAFQISQEIQYPMGAFKATMYSGIVHSDLSNYDSALYYYEKALPLSDKANDLRSKGVNYINMGNVYQFKGELDQAPDYYLKAIKYLEIIKDSNAIANTLVNLSSLFESLEQTDKQIEYLEQALTIIPTSNQQIIGISNGDLGLAYLNKGDLANAYSYFSISDSIARSGDFPRLDFFVNRNFGEYYYAQNRFIEAIDYYEKALTKGAEISDEYFKNDLYLNLGNANVEIEQYQKGTGYLLKAYNMGKSSGALEIQNKATLNLAKCYSKLEKPEEAFKFQELHRQLQDSIFNIEKVRAINELEVKYETEKKDKEIAEKRLALQKSKSQTRLFTVLTIAGVLAIGLTLFSFRQRQKRKNQEILSLKREHQVKTLESLIEGEEKERTRIAKELHDGVNGDLSAIKFKLSALLHTNNEAINEAMNMIDRSCEQVRAISHNLIPPSLEDFNLIEALDNFAQKMNDLNAMNITFFHIGEMISISKNSELNIFRIVQELVSNSIKHSGGNEINVQVSTINEMLQLSVEDNGKGFDTANTSKQGIGLKNIQSRIDYLGATIDVDSSKEGTSYVIEIQKNELDDH